MQSALADQAGKAGVLLARDLVDWARAVAVADADGSVVSWNPREATTKPLLGPSADQTGGTSLAANAATGTFVVARFTFSLEDS